MTFFKQRLGSRLALFATIACLFAAPTPAFAGSYWVGFKRFWMDYIAQTDGVVLTALLVGLVSLFIITRGKWAKS